MSEPVEYNEEGIRMAVDFFNNLADEEKALIVSDLNPNTFKIPQYYDDLIHLLSMIQMDITTYDSITIGNKLMDMGMEETWARLLVTNMKKHAPTLQYQVSQINRIDDDRFVDIFARMVDHLWIDKADKEEVMEKFNVNAEQLHCIISVVTRYMHELLRGDNSAGRVYGTLLESGMTKAKADAMIQVLHMLDDDWYKWLLFRNVQDTAYHMQEIKEQNANILETLKEMMALLKDQRYERRTIQMPGQAPIHGGERPGGRDP